MAESQRSDVEYLSLMERLKSIHVDKSITINRYYASKTLISLLYEKNVTKQNLEEEVKNVKGLQAEFDMLVSRALKEGVSDIHIEVRRDDALVRFRKNGKLYKAKGGDWSVQYARQMAVVIYQVIAEEKDVTFVETQQQSAIIDRKLDEHRVRIRLNTMPAYPDGFDMVMRLLKMGVQNEILELDSLGYFPEQVESIKDALSKPVGVTIIAGVTGSGKSTSLATMLSSIVRESTTPEGEVEIKIITVEDPPEYQIPHVTQSPVVNSRGGKTRAELFIEAIKAALRCDPDIIMIGEVRDRDSANLLTKAVQTGHKGFTTIHAASGIGIIGRLRAEGVPDDILGSKDFISGLMYQTLVPIVCPHCGLKSREYFEQNKNSINSEELYRRLNEVLLDDEIELLKFKNPEGCKHCQFKGISGRTVVAEIIIPNEEMLEAISNRDDNKAWQIFLQNGGKTVLDSGIEKMKMGLCDPHDIEENLGRVNSQMFSRRKKIESKTKDISKDEFGSKLLSGKTGKGTRIEIDFKNNNDENNNEE